MQRVGLDGAANGEPVVVAVGDVAAPAIAVRPDGGALVTWRRRSGTHAEVFGRLLAPGSAAPQGPDGVQLTTSAPPRAGAEETDFGTGALQQSVAWDGARWLLAWARLTNGRDVCRGGGGEGGCEELFRIGMEARLRAIGPDLGPGGPEVVALPETTTTDRVIKPAIAVGPGEAMVTWPGGRIAQATFAGPQLERRTTFPLAQDTRLKRRMTLRVRCTGEPCPVLRLGKLSVCRDRLCVSGVVGRVRRTTRRTSPTEMRISVSFTVRQLRAIRRRRALLVATVNAADATGNDTQHYERGDPSLVVRLR